MANNYKHISRLVALFALMLVTMGAQAQITQVHGTVTDEYGELMGATVCEIDGNGRIIESALTDMSGNFTMKVRNVKDKIRFSYVGLKTQTMPINRTTYNVKMASATVINEVVVKAKKRVSGGNGLPIPEREVSYASQKISMKEFEGLGMTSIDEALQGRIAGLDIIGNSGDLGSGSTMRLRGATSLSSLTDENPLIVIDGNIRSVDMSGFDLASANNEKFAELLNINPEDIADIQVLKDAAATAIYGSEGGNGVIEITTKRGTIGKPVISYSLKLTMTHQPDGYKYLNGDEYTMLLKESYFNPRQNQDVSNIRELNYDKTFSEYEQYNNNTDWVDAVKQNGLRQNHYVSISGGGEKAKFRIGAGFDHETGTIIEQSLKRFSTRVALDYDVSERIRVSTNFSLTYTENNLNSDGLLGIAQVKMPNMSIYEQDPVTGANTNTYYNMLQSASSAFDGNQKNLVNPVASGNLAKKQQRTNDMSPELVINYRLLGLDEDHWRLDWRGSVYMNIFNRNDDSFYPQELRTWTIDKDVNTTAKGSSKSVSFTTKHTLTLYPHFNNKDISMLAMGRFEMRTGSSTNQGSNGRRLPSGGFKDSDAGGLIQSISSNWSQWRSMYFTLSSHFAYKERYIADVSVRADATTRFGPGKRWGYFPAVSLRWNVIDEPFMKSTRKWLSMLSIRPSWGRTGNQPNQDYLYTSKYVSATSYLDMTAMRPENIRLTDMRWQINTSYNLGMDIGLLDDRFNLTFEVYSSTTTDMLMANYRIASSSGFGSLPYRNNGKLRNVGWEFHVNTNKFITAGKFQFDMNVNFGNNRNEILEMDPYIIESMNTNINYNNNQILQRVQVHNPFGAIYGYRYKGVYQYNYDTYANMTPEQRADFDANGHTAPVARNAAGKVILDADGKPVRMRYNYTNDASGRNYMFCGGDAIYDDVNHDGNIDALDIVYLGSSLPKLTGGFGFTFRYGDWRLTTQFNYRVGNKIFNQARLNSEAMISNDNQSQAVNYRWRKEGDLTTIPRAMFGASTNYNTLASDRFVEDGSYLRMGYAQLSYTIKKKYLKWIGLGKISLYLSANNPFVITKYTGADPDVASSGYGPAVDNSKTPRSRSYTFGMTVDF